MNTKTGTLYGVGIGPGDPELITLKALSIIQSSPIIAYPANPQGQSQARDTVARWLDSGQREIPITIPFQTDRGPANEAYDQAAITLGEALSEGGDVAVLCEGDPLFFGSFIYLYQRLAEEFSCVIIPGINAVSAATAITETPLSSGNDRIAIVPATAGDEAIRRALADYDSIAIVKPGRHRPQVLELLRDSGRADDVIYIEHATRKGQRIFTELDDVPDTPGPYFALFLITRRDHS